MSSESVAPSAPAAATAITRRVAGFIAEIDAGEPPPGARELAELHLLDTLASVVACRDLRAGEVARAYARAHAPGDVPVLGTPDRATLLDAAFTSAIIAHGAEINDFCPAAFVQPGPGVVSTAMCLGAARESTGRSVIRAIAAGYEIACRLPRAIGNQHLRRAGVANHSIGSLFGAATAAAGLLRFDAIQAEDLLSYCAQQASGSWQWMLDVEHLEKSFVFGGMAVHNGLHAALLVEAGFTGVPEALDVAGGWLHGGLRAGVDDDSLALLVDGLGQSHCLDLVGYKQFPVGGPVQPIVAGMLDLIATGEFTAADVERIRVEMPGSASTFDQARMPALNARYLLAVILLDGELDFVAAQSLDRFHHDAAVRDLMERIAVVHDPSQDTEPRAESARLTVSLRDGREIGTYVDHVRGYPSHPLDRDEVVDKARGLLRRSFDAARTEHVIETTLGIDGLESVAPIIAAIERD